MRKPNLEKLSEFFQDVKLISSKMGITAQTIAEPGPKPLRLCYPWEIQEFYNSCYNTW